MSELKLNVQSMETKMIPLEEIVVTQRGRADNGDIPGLANSIRERGMINPITVMRQAEGGYLLVCGARRLAAVRFLGETEIRASVASPMEADELLMMEFEENEQRKDFTLEERLAFRDKIAAVEKERARERMGYRRGEADQGVGDCPPLGDEEEETSDSQLPEKGKARDLIAKKAGFGSARTMKRVDDIAENRPDLLEAIDQKKISINRAHDIVTGRVSEDEPEATPKKPAPRKTKAKDPQDDFIAEEPVDVEVYEPFRPFLEPAPGKVSTVRGADHEHLMENPIYKRLYESYMDASQKLNGCLGDMQFRCEGYERRIRGYKESIQAMERQYDDLQEKYRALLSKLEAGNRA